MGIEKWDRDELVSKTSESNSHLENSHPIQKMMSRTGSFPVEVAYDLLTRYSDGKAVVLDPFCGKGSTLLAARLLGHSAYGIDVAPEAVVCSSAKLVSVTISSFMSYMSSIRLGRPSLNEVPTAVSTFFHDTTLKQIISLRDRFKRDQKSVNKRIRSYATFGMGCLLGILHGHASYSLSISSSHAFSMSPKYVARYAAAHGLLPPERDVKQCVLTKAKQLLKRKLPKVVPGEVRYGNAASLPDHFPSLLGKVDVILTSPPYLNAQTYAKDNWLRLWLLGYDYREIRHSYIETGSVLRFEHQLSQVFEKCYQMLRTGGRLICIAGDVRLRNKRSENGNGVPIFRTGEELASLASKSNRGFEIVDRGVHVVNSTSRYFHSISKSTGHEPRELVERFFVAQKNDI